MSTCSTLTLQGSSGVGGNGEAPKSKKTFETIRGTVSEENASVSSIFVSPESFLGVPPGSLDEYKVDKLPSEPFRGIYYFTEDPGPLNFGNFASGIMMVSNSIKTIELKANSGEIFKGLIITDNMDRFNENVKIMGAVAILSNGDPVKNNANGTADVHYSSRLENLGQYCTNLKKNLREASWKELD